MNRLMRYDHNAFRAGDARVAGTSMYVCPLFGLLGCFPLSREAWLEGR